MTARQFYFTLFIFAVSIRVQKMPSLMAGVIGKESYILIALFFVIDFIFILLAFFVLKYLKINNKIVKKSKFCKVVKSIILIFVSVYFMFQCTLLYESMQDLFSHILFDSLPWTLFSLLLIFCLGFIASSGFKCAGRLIEILFFVIVFSYGIIAIFGAIQTDFTEILPLETINFNEIMKYFVPFNLWFGDFFLVLFLGKHSQNIKLSKTLLTYAFALILVLVLTLEFYGIYAVLTPLQPSLVGTITEMSMLGVDIGRLDWFLILFAEMGTIVCSSICLCIAKECLSEAFSKVKPIYLLLVLLIALYLSDVLLLVDTNIKEKVFFDFASGYAMAVKAIVFGLALFASIIEKLKKNKNKLSEKSKNNLKIKNAKYRKFSQNSALKPWYFQKFDKNQKNSNVKSAKNQTKLKNLKFKPEAKKYE